MLRMLIAAAAALTVAAPATAQVEAPGKDFREGFVQAGGFRVRYMEAGPNDAPVIVSLPGSAGLEMSRAKDRLARDFRIIEFQPPGWGGDTQLNREMEQEEVGRILGEAANQLVQGRYHVLGTSMGGGNALWLVAHNPSRVKSLILEGGMAPARVSDLHSPLIQRAQIRQMLSSGGPPGGYPTPPPDPEKPWATREYVQNQMQVRFRMMQWVQTDVGAEPLFSRVRAANVPVLALQGDKDGILKPTTGEYVRQVLPNARFVLVAGGQHDLQNSRTEDFVREVSAFVRANEAR